MKIRRASEKDIEKILSLLSQVLEIHAKIRPDIFVSGTTKYTRAELLDLFCDDQKPVFVAVDDEDTVLGYAFCAIKHQPFSTNMIPFKTLFIDDLCVDEQSRGNHVGRFLFDYVRDYAKNLGCYEVTLNVWEGNTPAQAFYDKLGFKPKETQMEFIL
jgi:ribosomal protein S18 acetylase RimI-like enzyme